MKLLAALFVLVTSSSWAFEQGSSGALKSFPRIVSLQQIPQTKPEEVVMEEWPHEEITPELKEKLLRSIGSMRLSRAHSLQRDAAIELHSEGQSSIPALVYKTAGIPQTDFSPPDPTIAVGGKHIIVAVNRVFAIYSKQGKLLFQTSMKSWFGSLPDAPAAGFFDCRVSYDQYAGHYLVLSEGVRPGDRRSWYFLSVSRTRNPLGSWAMYELDMQLNGTHRAKIVADFPGLGFDHFTIYLTGNMFHLTGDFAYGKIRVIRKSQLYSFGEVQWSDFWNMIDATGARAKNIQPAHCFGATSAGYLANTNEAKGDKLTLWIVSDAGTSSPSLSSIAVPVSSYLVPPNAQQKGTSIRISTNDSGLTSAVFRNGRLSTAQALAWDWGSGTVSAIRYYEISSTGSLIQEITYGADGKYYFFPDVMTDPTGNVTILFNRSSPSEYAGIFYTGRLSTDPPGALRGASRLQAGLASYKDANRNGLDPWGDFNGIALDPVDRSVWLFSEFTKTAISWGTQIGRVVFRL